MYPDQHSSNVDMPWCDGNDHDARAEEAFWQLARPALFTGFGCFASALSITVGVVAQFVHSNGLAYLLSTFCLVVLGFAWGVLPWLGCRVCD